MTDKMREGQLWSFMHDRLNEAYKKLSMTGTRYEYYAMLDAIASNMADDIEARFMQAAKSVPVVGEPVAWLDAKKYELLLSAKDYGSSINAYLETVKTSPSMQPLYHKPTTSTTEAELERLRKDAERYRWLRNDAFEHSEDCFFEAGRLFAGHQGDSFDVAIDAAIAAEGEKK